jgi:RNA polymerase sigma-70 factor, ECF subfamily
VTRYADLSSAELVQVCASSKDEAAWAEFIRRFQAVIAAAVLRTARHWGECSHPYLDDLIQDTYLKLCSDDNRLLRSFEPQHADSIYGYLKVMAANVAHDHFKAAQAAKRRRGPNEADAEPIEIRPGRGVIDSFERASQRMQLEKIDKMLMLAASPRDIDRNRTIFWLRHRQGLTATEIASIPSIGLSTEGVESVLMRLTLMIRSHIINSSRHREVKVLKRQNRSKRLGS